MNRVSAILTLLIAPAVFAQNSRSAVSVSGIDSNPCTPAAPCRSFSVAVATTVSGGEIIALDSAGYGPFVIDRSLTVTGAPAAHAAITTSADGITIAAGTPVNATLRNLTILGTSGSGNGVKDVSGGIVRISNCTIRGFETAAVQATQGSLSVDASTLLDNPGTGIAVFNAPGAGTVRATVSDSLIQGSTIGVTAGQATSIVIRATTIALGTDGILAESLGGGGTLKATVVLQKSVIALNQGAGVRLNADGNNSADLWISDTLLTSNAQSIVNVANGNLFTYQNNAAINNADGFFFPQTSPQFTY